MRLLDRYLIREFLKTYLIVFLSFSVVFIVIDVIDNLAPLMRSGATPQLAILYYLLRLPYLIVLTSPVTVLITGLFLMNSLSKHNESVAMRAAGISITRAMLPLFGLGLLISLGVAVFGEYVLPWAEKTRNYVYDVKIQGAQAEDNLLKARVHYHGTKNDFYYFAFFDGYQNTIRVIDLTKLDPKGKEVSERVTASSAVWQKDRWLLQDCEIRRFEKGKQTYYAYYPSTTLPLLDVKPEDFVRITKKTLSLNFPELREYIARLNRMGEPANREIVDLHMKLAFPLTNLIVIFFFIPVATSNTRSKSRGLVFLLGLVVCFLYLIMVRVAQSLGYSGVIPPVWAAWLPNLIFTLLGLAFLRKAEI
ncbi:MAG TPA: LPS export ABC transporter permease LptG [Candidatus Syntrophosphaera sp.]|nr:LPS export ABC transporter permease LptG [Candidatus Syntrophosphaera sp.]HOH48629.1 LPS export ABC transporter permease LptG [Candidatus Syntrophosphaera sp.]HPX67490.1 LPS export ABC transporter permease LptG [Candidatus Syntrophosphaera sp.]HQC47335.1 LPS export ABC transporter permease LptG [Candidatus Syntrophosphaera sp.]